VGLLQVGVTLSSEALGWRWSRLDPAAGLRHLLNAGAVVELAKAPVKLAIIGGMAWITVAPRLGELVSSAAREPAQALAAVGPLTLTLLWRVGLAHGLLAAADYLYQRWSLQKSLRMTREEVKDESRQSEVDPQIRARFRALHRQYTRRRMLQDVATADVVVTNPTHLAVALRYRAETMQAPQVVAKGARLLAEQIRERARWAGVPLVEHRPLAQALYKVVPVGGEIPAALYRAVAEILAYVWALGAGRARG
jgi:flagellar biosynthetic protein FlhB